MIDRVRSAIASRTAYDSMISFSGTLAVAVAGMLFTVLAARSLTPFEFGVFSTFMAVAIMLANVADLGVSNVLTNFLPKHPKDRSKIISAGFWFQMFVSGGIFLICGSLIFVGDKLFGTSDPWAFLLFALLGAGYVVDYFWQNLMRAEKMFLQSSVMQALESFGKLLLLFLAAFLGRERLGVEALMAVSLIGAFTAIAYALMHYKKVVRAFEGLGHVARFAEFGAWMAVNKVFGVMVARVDMLILNWLAGPYQTGLFAAASRVAMLFSVLVGTLGSVTAPRFAGFNSKDKVKRYLAKMSLMVGALTMLMLMTALLSETIVTLVFGEEYIPAIGVFRYLSLAMIPFLWTTLTVTPLIYTYGMARLNAVLTLVQVLVLVGTEILLAPVYGAYAAVAGLFLSNMVVLVTSGLILLVRLRV